MFKLLKHRKRTFTFLYGKEADMVLYNVTFFMLKKLLFIYEGSFYNHHI